MRSWTLLAFVGCALDVPASGQGLQGPVELVSQASDGSPADGPSEQAAISADGRVVAFLSGADNLAPGDCPNCYNVFVRDRAAGTTELAARTLSGGNVNQGSEKPSLSSDGRYVAFLSIATNIVPDSNGSRSDLFVRDRQLGVTSIESRTHTGLQSSGGVENGSISADGRWVVFESAAGDFVPGDTNGVSDIFVRNRQTGVVERVSLRGDRTQASLQSRFGSLSADGSRVAFASDEALVPEDVDVWEDVYVLDRPTGVLRLASPTFSGLPSDNESTEPVIALDGRTVAFAANDSRLVPGDLNHGMDVFWRDLVTNTTGVASVSTTGVLVGSRNYLALSGDGDVIAFLSSAPNVIPGVSANDRIYLRQRSTQETTLLDAAPDGTPGNARCLPRFALSLDGRWAAWSSHSSNLGAGDLPGFSDVFVRARQDCSRELRFEVEDDLLTPLVNGQHIDVEFGTLVTIASSGPNAGLAIFDSTPGGPNDPSQDRDLLVGTGNLLILQTENLPPDANDVFPRPNDDEDGGTMAFAFLVPVEAHSVRLVDVDAGDGATTLILTDAAQRRRTYTVPPNWTGDRLLGQPGHGLLDLTTLAPQPGFGSTATAAEDPGFEAGDVVGLELVLEGSGGLDDLEVCLSSSVFAAVSARGGSDASAVSLAAVSLPALGLSFSMSLDCSVQGIGTARLAVRSRATAGVLTPFGEQLVDGPLYFRAARSSSTSPISFRWAIPNDSALVGVQVHAQGLCLETPGPGGGKWLGMRGALSNALDLTLGL